MSNEENNVEEVVENKPFSVVDFLEKNSKNLTYAGIALVVIAAGFWYYTTKYLPNQEANAKADSFMAENLFASDSFDLALNGSANFTGLIDVADDHSGTLAGERANFLTGRGLMNQGKFEEAIEYLENVHFEDEIVAPLAVCLIGDCHVQLDDLATGAEYYLKAAKMRDNSFTAPYSYAKAARALSAAEDFAGAVEALEMIKKDYSETQFAREIDKEIAMAKASMK
ncbi:MAG: hypothetical protein JJ975_10865 [Bacteroidia bacterium]|nr:hypothetical protein [Bacteroidia bacterium]